MNHATASMKSASSVKPGIHGVDELPAGSGDQAKKTVIRIGCGRRGCYHAMRLHGPSAGTSALLSWLKHLTYDRMLRGGGR
jgi:hypothetical protein